MELVPQTVQILSHLTLVDLDLGDIFLQGLDVRLDPRHSFFQHRPPPSIHRFAPICVIPADRKSLMEVIYCPALRILRMMPALWPVSGSSH